MTMSNPYIINTRAPNVPLWQRMAQRRVPLTFDLELTARCNNACRHCYINLPVEDAAARAHELTRTEIADLADQAVELGALWCLLTGGEPLLRDDFADIYLDLKKRGLLLSVFTNACLVTADHIELWRRYPPRVIEVSVYGVTENTYERVTRRAGSYAAFRRGLDLLLESGLRVRLKATIGRSNASELAEIARFCRPRTADYFRFDAFLSLRQDGDVGRNREILDERLSPSEMVRCDSLDQERTSALRRKCEAIGSMETVDPAKGELFRCGAGAASFNVGYDGLFRLCSALHHPDYTVDLRKSRLAQVWHEWVPGIRALRPEDPRVRDRCMGCDLITLCGWCPAHALLEGGKLDSWSDYFCEVTEARIAAIEEAGGLPFSARRTARDDGQDGGQSDDQDHGRDEGSDNGTAASNEPGAQP
jgi:radical SAM protein with 4Fe4S-binding SPASM domain